MHFDILMSFHVFADFAKKKKNEIKRNGGKSKKKGNCTKNQSLFPFVRF